MTEEKEPSTTAGSEEQSSRFPWWLGVVAALALLVIGVIVYGYWAKPGWVGSADEKFWDYLDLLIVPAALAFGVY